MAVKDKNLTENGYEASVPTFNPDILMGQSFTASASYTLDSVVFQLQKNAGSPGTLTVSLYATDGSGLPTGAALSTGNTEGDTLPTSGFEEREVSMTAYSIVLSTKYCVIIDQASAANGNGWSAQGSDANPYAGGSLVHNNTGSYANYVTYDLWFKVQSAATLPTKASTPSPANAATDVDFSGLQLSWVDGGDTDTYNVYVGETGSPTLVSSTQAGTTYTTTMSELATIFSASPIDQVIYWRIDSTNVTGTTTGDEWSFDARPIKASVPSPANTATSTAVSFAATWTGSAIATTYNTLANVGAGLVSQSTGLESATWTADPNIFDYITAYTWRVDSVNAFGTTVGDEWTFTTLRFDPPTPTEYYETTGQYYYLLIQSDGSYGDPPGTGVENTDYVYLAAGYEANFIKTTRKLVAIAENRFWYENI